MSALTTSDSTVGALSPSHPARVGLASLALGIVAAALTMILSLLSLGLGVLAIVLGGVALARRETPVPPAVAVTAATVSIVLILQEVLILGN